MWIKWGTLNSRTYKIVGYLAGLVVQSKDNKNCRTRLRWIVWREFLTNMGFSGLAVDPGEFRDRTFLAHLIAALPEISLIPYTISVLLDGRCSKMLFHWLTPSISAPFCEKRHLPRFTRFAPSLAHRLNHAGIVLKIYSFGSTFVRLVTFVLFLRLSTYLVSRLLPPVLLETNLICGTFCEQNDSNGDCRMAQKLPQHKPFAGNEA